MHDIYWRGLTAWCRQPVGRRKEYLLRIASFNQDALCGQTTAKPALVLCHWLGWRPLWTSRSRVEATPSLCIEYDEKQVKTMWKTRWKTGKHKVKNDVKKMKRGCEKLCEKRCEKLCEKLCEKNKREILSPTSFSHAKACFPPHVFYDVFRSNLGVKTRGEKTPRPRPNLRGTPEYPRGTPGVPLCVPQGPRIPGYPKVPQGVWGCPGVPRCAPL